MGELIEALIYIKINPLKYPDKVFVSIKWDCFFKWRNYKYEDNGLSTDSQYMISPNHLYLK